MRGDTTMRVRGVLNSYRMDQKYETVYSWSYMAPVEHIPIGEVTATFEIQLRGGGSISFREVPASMLKQALGRRVPAPSHELEVEIRRARHARPRRHK